MAIYIRFQNPLVTLAIYLFQTKVGNAGDSIYFTASTRRMHTGCLRLLWELLNCQSRANPKLDLHTNSSVHIAKHTLQNRVQRARDLVIVTLTRIPLIRDYTRLDSIPFRHTHRPLSRESNTTLMTAQMSCKTLR